MTVIDEVLAAETAAEAKLHEAKEAAVASVNTAKKTQTEVLQTEKNRLAAVENTEVTAHQARVQASAEKIVQDAQAKVSVVENQFSQKATQIVSKIKATLS